MLLLTIRVGNWPLYGQGGTSVRERLHASAPNVVRFRYGSKLRGWVGEVSGSSAGLESLFSRGQRPPRERPGFTKKFSPLRRSSMSFHDRRIMQILYPCAASFAGACVARGPQW